MALVKQPTNKPTRKMKFAGAGGLVAAISIAVVDYYAPGMGEHIGPAIAALIVAAASFVTGYFAKDRV